MTGIAIIRTVDMRVRLAAGSVSIVAGDTGTQNFIMVYVTWCDRYPGYRAWFMTGRAVVG